MNVGRKAKQLSISIGVFAIVVGLALCGPPVFAVNPSPSSLDLRETKKALAALSLPFIENQGQMSDEVAFYAMTFGGTLFVTKTGDMVYTLPVAERTAQTTETRPRRHAHHRGETFTIVERIAGATCHLSHYSDQSLSCFSDQRIII